MATTISDEVNSIGGHEQPHRTTRLRGPDVVIVVGGKEFHQNSHHLRSISDYFEAAFRSGMKESQTMKFDFPDKNPDDWELVLALLEPFGSLALDQERLELALPWFDELGISVGVQACDKYLANQLCSGARKPSPPLRQTIDELLGNLQRSYQYELVDSREHCKKSVAKLLRSYPSSLNQDHWGLVCSLLAEYEGCRNGLWDILATNLSSGVLAQGEPDALLGNCLLPTLIFLEVQQSAKDAGIKEIISISKPYINSLGPTNTLYWSEKCAKAVQKPAGMNVASNETFRAWQWLWK